MITIKRGLDLPINGAPKNTQDVLPKKPSRLAVVGFDFVGMKPTMRVKVGDSVKKGDILFTCKKTDGVIYTSPCSGKVLEVNRGDKRVFQSVVVENSGDDHISFSSYKDSDASSYSVEEMKNLLLESGEWTALRARPFSKVADPQTLPSSIFITATDTNPLAGDVNAILALDNNEELFNAGINAISRLGIQIHLCVGKGFKAKSNNELVKEHTFSGVHPAGNVGTHIHHIDPVSAKKIVWHIGYQDIIALGGLLKTGKLHTDRYIALGGPRVRNPRIFKATRGMNIKEIFESEVYDYSDLRFISGSVLNGRTANGPFDYLGRFHNQVSVIEDSAKREFLGWHMPGAKKFSLSRAFLSAFLPKKKYDFTTNANGSHRALLSIGNFQKVMPLDIEPTFLLRALLGGDTNRAQELGALELDEEDVALLSFVDAGKNEFGSLLRENLAVIEKEG